MNKFKIGDKVRIKKDLEVGFKYNNVCLFNSKMEKYKGKVAVIKSYHIASYFNGNVEIKDANNYRYRLNIDNGEWDWSLSMLEKVENKKHFKSLPKDFTGTIIVEKGFVVKKEILDEAEKEYLHAVIKPFKKQIVFIILRELSVESGRIYVHIELNNNDFIVLPNFKQGTMYKNMEIGRKYTLEELGLD